ncbi:hypothetical protein [Clostridium cylindrosporum]|uniref:Uncharacterized protein n=1 Tax=Clostridium cylindrosporum DSM 605 TaxID=1121307 RepID=A0A0J8DBR6_CLOCY|nr:hypothetical protein [Clostridium cylindrosporum]KMT23302.1 hypothetical protein CLCY_8c00380 [Clostridium cylindrosporum DSM 605]
MTKAKSILPIKGCIAPQLFNIEGESLIFFEKVNPEEGRFFTINDNGFKLLHNVYESHGMIEGGELYSVKIGVNTEIKRISKNPIHIQINGTYFDFKVDEDDNIVCLGHDGENSIIKIFSSTGEEIKNISLTSLFFASSIKVIGEYIWAAGFTANNEFKLVKINYIGALLEEFIIDSDADERLISKIQIDEERIYLNINGENDSIYILKRTGEKIRELYPKHLNMKEIVDFVVKNDEVYILSNKSIHIFDIKQMVECRDKLVAVPIVKENVKIPYAYFMIIEILKENFLISIISSIIIYTFIYSLGYIDLSLIQSVFFIWTLSGAFALSIGIFRLRSKSTRIMYLLHIQQKNISIGIERSLFLYTIVMSIFSLLFVYDLRIINGILYAIMLVLTLMIDKVFEGDMDHKREDIVVELLSGDKKLHSNLRNLINHSEKQEKILLNIKVEKDFNKKYLSKWNDSRSFILGRDINYIFLDKTFVGVIDLSKRDIKYSKISILADLITYIGERGTVKEVNAMWVD